MVVRRGYDQDEVRAFLDQVATEVRALHSRVDDLRAAAETAQAAAAEAASTAAPAAEAAPAPQEPRGPLDEDEVVALVGEQTAAVLRAARAAAVDLRRRAEADAERIIGDAREASVAMRQEAEAIRVSADAQSQQAAEAVRSAALAEADSIMTRARTDADAAREQAEQQRRLTVDGAQAMREKILGDLSRRRRVATVQIEQLRAGRERLLESYAVVRRTLEEVHDELQRADAEARTAADDAGRRAEMEADAALAGADSPARPSDPRPSDRPTAPTASRAGGSGPAASTTSGPTASTSAGPTASTRPGPVASTGSGPAASTIPSGAPSAGVQPAAAPTAAAQSTVAPVTAAPGAAPNGTAPTGPTGSTTADGPVRTSPAGDPADRGNATPGVSGTSAASVAGTAAVAAVVAGPSGSDGPAAGQDASERMRILRAGPEAQPSGAPTDRRSGPPTLRAVPGGLMAAGGAEPVRMVDEVAVDEPDEQPAVAPEPAVAEPTAAVDEAVVDEPAVVDEAVVDEAVVDEAVVGEPADEPAIVEGATVDGESGGRPAATDDLFARMRSNREASVAAAQEVLAAPATVSPAPMPSAPVADQRAAQAVASTPQSVPAADAGADRRSDEDEAALQRRDRLVADTETALTRRLKRVLQDEQNELLDRLRHTSGSPDPTTLLPDPEDHRATFVTAADGFLASAAAAGAGVPGSPAPEGVAGPLAVQLTSTLVEPLRRRLADAVRDAGDDHNAAVEAIGTVYRDCKTQRVEPAVFDAVVTAFAAGTYASAPAGTLLRWVVEDVDGPCADCDDNALAGYLPKGESWPTGQLHPPAHAGCRCLLAPAP